MHEKPEYEIEMYQAVNGKKPFEDWFKKLKDRTAKSKMASRLRRVARGNFGDHKPLKGTDKIFELREHYGKGYRIYYTIRNQKIVLILAGSDKAKQNKTIEKAKEYLADYEKEQDNA